MSKKEIAMKVIEKLMKEPYPIPSHFGMDLRTYMLRSYEAWAIRGLYRYFGESDLKDPIIIFEEFRALSDNMACIARTEKDNFKYSIVADVTTFVLDEYLIQPEIAFH